MQSVREKVAIVIYQQQFETLLRETISEEWEVQEWLPIDDINEKFEEYIECLYTHYKYSLEVEFITCIMINSRNLKTIVLQMLNALHVNSNQILDIYKAYMAGFSTKHYERIWERKQGIALDGLVLGISHGMTGIIEEKMPGNVCNFCKSSQDIYFNYRVLNQLYDNHYEWIKDLKYAVMDMFDYTYFNFDTIQIGAYEPFLEESGFLCEMRTPWNKTQDLIQINQTLYKMWQEGKTPRQQELLHMIFPQIKQRDDSLYKGGETVLKDRKHIITEEEIVSYQKNPTCSSIQVNIFDATLDFQIANFYNILKLLNIINPEMKIFLLLLPKYYIVEHMETEINKIWKEYFMEVIKKAKEKFPMLEIIDLKKCKEFSENLEYYQDLTHFNYFGACNFTDYLGEKLRSEYGLQM